MKVFYPLALTLIFVCAAAQAQVVKTAMPGMKMPAPTAAAASSLTDAVILKIDTASGLIVLKHGDIPNLGMPAMAMGFDVADKKMLERVKVGDKVRFYAEIIKGKPVVTQLEAAH